MKPLDYSESLIQARVMLKRAEDAALREDYASMQRTAESACLRCIALEQWADQRLLDSGVSELKSRAA